MVEGVKIMSETETDYKVMLALSVPKESLKDGQSALLEDCTYFNFIEVDTDIVSDVLHEQLSMSPQQSIMVKRREEMKPVVEPVRKKRHRK